MCGGIPNVTGCISAGSTQSCLVEAQVEQDTLGRPPHEHYRPLTEALTIMSSWTRGIDLHDVNSKIKGRS